jgi:hypothetical protein
LDAVSLRAVVKNFGAGRAVMVGGSGIAETVVWRGMLALLGFALLFLVAGARTLRRGLA